MRRILTALLVLVSSSAVLAQRNTLKPWDFQPLTSLPWEKPGATIDGVLSALYLEPNERIRYSLLLHYLHMIPVGELGNAFNICVAMEGTQTPDELVELLLTVWGERDPKGCWEKVQELMKLVGIENGWLSCDTWDEKPRITVQDLDAIRLSRFWLRYSSSLVAYAEGVENSKLSRDEKVEWLKGFTQQWFQRFKTWPGSSNHEAWKYPSIAKSAVSAFQTPIDRIPPLEKIDRHPSNEISFEIWARRLLAAKPHTAADVLNSAVTVHWPLVDGMRLARASSERPELLLLWSRLDTPAMIRWADNLSFVDGDITFRARGILMSRVDFTVRQRWLREAKTHGGRDDRDSLLSEWAGWNPIPALTFLLGRVDLPEIHAVGESVARGPWNTVPWNTCHSGLACFRTLDFESLTRRYEPDLFDGCVTIVMEQWGHVDIGETAQFGFDVLLRAKLWPRENLIGLFSGDKKYESDGDVLDRTFCALRVWAVIRPDEMKAWIAKQQGEDMRKALAWLLENPWGTGPAE